jgi:hypothetical protein
MPVLRHFLFVLYKSIQEEVKMIGVLNEPVAIVDLGVFECPECLEKNEDYLIIKPSKVVIRDGTVCCPHIDGREIGQILPSDEAIRLLKVAAEDSESAEYKEIVQKAIGFLRGQCAFPATREMIKK